MASASHPLRLIEHCSGVGALTAQDRVFSGIGYDVRRFQGMAPTGMPIPGLHRIEGTLDIAARPELRELIGSNLVLRLEDGRAWRITLAAADGRILSEGHGPSRCLCC